MHFNAKKYSSCDIYFSENGIAENTSKISKLKNEGKLITLGGKLAQPSAKPVIKETEVVGVYMKPVNLEIPSGIDVVGSASFHEPFF